VWRVSFLWPIVSYSWHGWSIDETVSDCRSCNVFRSQGEKTIIINFSSRKQHGPPPEWNNALLISHDSIHFLPWHSQTSFFFLTRDEHQIKYYFRSHSDVWTCSFERTNLMSRLISDEDHRFLFLSARCERRTASEHTYFSHIHYISLNIKSSNDRRMTRDVMLSLLWSFICLNVQ
jgi:hypothetical protein